MNKAQVEKLLSILKARNIYPMESWVKCSCIFAKHTHKSGKDNNPSSGVAFNTSVNMYNCYSCGKAMPIDDALLELLTLNRKAGIMDSNVSAALNYLSDLDSEDFVYENFEQQAPDKKNFYDFTEGWLNSFSPVTSFQQAMDYLKNREGGEVPLKVISDFDLRYDQPKRVIGFPYRNWDNNKVAGMRGRSIDTLINTDPTKKHLRHYDYSYDKHNNTSITWYRESELNPDKPLIVVEGEFDAARVYQLYRNVTAILTASVSTSKMEKLCQFTEGVYWLTDTDSAGDISREKARPFFESKGVNYVDLKSPEGYNDPGETPIKFLKYSLKEHLDLDEIID